MLEISFKKMSLWKNIIGILSIILGIAAIVLTCYVRFNVFPGDWEPRSYLWLYIVTFIGGAGAVGMGTLLLLLKITPQK